MPYVRADAQPSVAHPQLRAVAGQGIELIDDLDLVGYDIPEVGATERLAYDPSVTSRFVLLKPE